MMTAIDRIGVIVSWKAPTEVSFHNLRDAITNAGLDASLARDMLPRHAFSRAATEMSEARIIKKVEESKDRLVFQFTKEYLHSGEWQYAKEAVLSLNKKTGDVFSQDYTLANHAQLLVHKHIMRRTAADVSRIVQKVFEKYGGDLVPLRDQGGVYFVPDSCAWLVQAVESLLLAIGGGLRKFQLHGGDDSTDASVANAMADHVLALVKDFRDSCESITKESDQEVVVRRLNGLKDLRAKLTAYSTLLAYHSTNLETAMDDAEDALLAKLTA